MPYKTVVLSYILLFYKLDKGPLAQIIMIRLVCSPHVNVSSKLMPSNLTGKFMHQPFLN